MLKNPIIYLFIFILTVNSSFSMKPTAIVNGLALYKIGKGPPVFVVPYPHAATFVSIADDSLTKIILETGHSVITFDPPGAYNSTRAAKVDMQEMIDCANEALDYFEINEPVDFVGHSMGSFCALAYAIQYQEKVNRLILVGSTTGWTAMRKYGVHKSWKWTDKEFWLSRLWGTKIYLGFNNLKTYNKLNNIVNHRSFVNKDYVKLFPIHRKDYKKPVPIRGKWLKNVKNYDYKDNLCNLNIPVLICVGLKDPQTPLIMNKELNIGIKNSELIIFNNSGHSPFIEERENFLKVVYNFLK